jgi:hypothetical protein
VKRELQGILDKAAAKLKAAQILLDIDAIV